MVAVVTVMYHTLGKIVPWVYCNRICKWLGSAKSQRYHETIVLFRLPHENHELLVCTVRTHVNVENAKKISEKLHKIKNTLGMNIMTAWYFF